MQKVPLAAPEQKIPEVTAASSAASVSVSGADIAPPPMTSAGSMQRTVPDEGSFDAVASAIKNLVQSTSRGRHGALGPMSSADAVSGELTQSVSPEGDIPQQEQGVGPAAAGSVQGMQHGAGLDLPDWRELATQTLSYLRTLKDKTARRTVNTSSLNQNSRHYLDLIEQEVAQGTPLHGNEHALGEVVDGVPADFTLSAQYQGSNSEAEDALTKAQREAKAVLSAAPANEPLTGQVGAPAAPSSTLTPEVELSYATADTVPSEQLPQQTKQPDAVPEKESHPQTAQETVSSALPSVSAASSTQSPAVETALAPVAGSPAAAPGDVYSVAGSNEFEADSDDEDPDEAAESEGEESAEHTAGDAVYLQTQTGTQLMEQSGGSAKSAGALYDGDPSAAPPAIREQRRAMLPVRRERQLNHLDFLPQVARTDPWMRDFISAGYTDTQNTAIYAALCKSVRQISSSDPYDWVVIMSDENQLFIDDPSFTHNLTTRFSVLVNHPLKLVLQSCHGNPQGCPDELCKLAYLDAVNAARTKLGQLKPLVELLALLGNDLGSAGLTLYTQESPAS